MNRQIRRTGQLIFSNFHWKLLSLAIAAVIWALVASEPEMALFTTVHLEYRNLPQDLEISSIPYESVQLELKGPTGELRGDSLRPAVVLDAGGLGPGMHSFTINGRNVRLPRTVRLVSAKPSQVSIGFEPHAERVVPVQVRWIGETPPRFTVQPLAVGIEGPAGHVARITAVITDPINLANMTGSAVRVNVITAPEDSYVRFRSGAQVRVEVGK